MSLAEEKIGRGTSEVVDKVEQCVLPLRQNGHSGEGRREGREVKRKRQP